MLEPEDRLVIPHRLRHLIWTAYTGEERDIVRLYGLDRVVGLDIRTLPLVKELCRRQRFVAGEVESWGVAAAGTPGMTYAVCSCTCSKAGSSNATRTRGVSRGKRKFCNFLDAILDRSITMVFLRVRGLCTRGFIHARTTQVQVDCVMQRRRGIFGFRYCVIFVPSAPSIGHELLRSPGPINPAT